MFASKNLTAGQLNALVKKLGGEERVHQILSDDVEIAFNEKHLLEPVATCRADGAEQFHAAKKFHEGENDGVKIAYVNSIFEKNFQNKVERDVESAKLQTHDLQESARDPRIITELGGEAVAETSLAHLWSLLKSQGTGENDGVLLVNGYANIFYIRDTNGALWAVRARWRSHDGGWSVNAFSLEHPDDWLAGFRLFSRDF